MQKAFVAIAFALALTSAFAAYTAQNYSKPPVPVCSDAETNFTNMSSLTLASITPGNIYLLSGNLSVNTGNSSANSWNLWYRQLDNKALTISNNYTASFTAPVAIMYINNYAIGFNSDNDSSIPQVRAYQLPLSGNGPARLQISGNTNNTFTPAPLAFTAIKTTVYVAYLCAANKINVTNFAVGSATVGTPEFTLTTTADAPSTLSLAWGEALGNTQLLAVWTENGALKDAVLDVSKGTVNSPTTVGGWNSSYICFPYTTDKKWYGEFCVLGAPNGMLNYYVRTNTTSLAQVVSYPANTSMIGGVLPYGPYVAVLFQDSITAAPSATYAYELWNLDTLTVVPGPKNFNRTNFLTIDKNSTMVPFRVTSGGLYSLLYNVRQAANGTLTSVQVGLVLGSSYLASILGFIMTIVAGLLLF